MTLGPGAHEVHLLDLLHPNALGLDEIPLELLDLAPEHLTPLELVHGLPVHLDELLLSGLMVVPSLAKLFGSIGIYDTLTLVIAIYDALFLLAILVLIA